MAKEREMKTDKVWIIECAYKGGTKWGAMSDYCFTYRNDAMEQLAILRKLSDPMYRVTGYVPQAKK
jgi:hypothetical protein